MGTLILSNVSLVGDPGLNSQVGYVLSMDDKKPNASIVHYRSSRCHRITLSVIAAKVHAITPAVDIGMILPSTLNEFL